MENKIPTFREWFCCDRNRCDWLQLEPAYSQWFRWEWNQIHRIGVIIGTFPYTEFPMMMKYIKIIYSHHFTVSCHCNYVKRQRTTSCQKLARTTSFSVVCHTTLKQVMRKTQNHVFCWDLFIIVSDDDESHTRPFCYLYALKADFSFFLQWKVGILFSIQNFFLESF